jgi:hypothetical protein
MFGLVERCPNFLPLRDAKIAKGLAAVTQNSRRMRAFLTLLL